MVSYMAFEDKEQLEERGYSFQSGSDCELLLPLFDAYGLEMFRHLDAEFACILYDGNTGKVIAAERSYWDSSVILRIF